MWVSGAKWIEGQSGYEMSRSLAPDASEALFFSELTPSLARAPDFAGLEEELCPDVRNGSPMTVDPVFGRKLLSNRSDSDRSSLSVEHELLCQSLKRKRTDRGKLPSDETGMLQGKHGGFSSPLFYVQDSVSSYRDSDVFVGPSRDHGPCAGCDGGGYSPPATLERALGTQYPLFNSLGWMQQRHCSFLQHSPQQRVPSNGIDEGRDWTMYRGTEEGVRLSPQLTQQIYVYPGRPVEQTAEAEPAPGKRRMCRKRENLPKESTAVLKKWLLSHLLMPYPVNEEKLALCCSTGLEISQINNWFINARVRIWKPLVTKVFQTYQSKLKTLAEESGDESLARRIQDAEKSTTMGMITLLTSLPEARKALDRAADDSLVQTP